MKPFQWTGVIFVFALLQLPGPTVLAQNRAHTFLKTVGKFGDSELSALDKGDVITTTIDTGDETDSPSWGPSG